MVWKAESIWLNNMGNIYNLVKSQTLRHGWELDDNVWNIDLWLDDEMTVVDETEEFYFRYGIMGVMRSNISPLTYFDLISYWLFHFKLYNDWTECGHVILSWDLVWVW